MANLSKFTIFCRNSGVGKEAEIRARADRDRIQKNLVQMRDRSRSLLIGNIDERGVNMITIAAISLEEVQKLCELTGDLIKDGTVVVRGRRPPQEGKQYKGVARVASERSAIWNGPRVTNGLRDTSHLDEE